MIIYRKVSWIIGMIAIIIVLSDSITFVKLRKSRKRLTTNKSEISYQQQQSVVEPLIVKVIHNYSDDVHGVSFKNTLFIHRVKHDPLNLSNYKNHNNISYHGENDPLPKERYIVHSKRYENYLSKKNTRRMNRNKRNITLSDTSDRRGVDSDNGDTIKVMKDKNKLGKNVLREMVPIKPIKIKNIWEYMEDFNGKRRNLSKRDINVTDCRFCDQGGNEHKINRTRKSYYHEYLLPRRNTSDYYTERRAVMERYYARQREINARYNNRTNDNFRLRTNGNGLPSQSTESNASLFELRHEYPNTISHYYYPSSITINPLYNNRTKVNNGIQIKVNNSRDIISDTKFDYKYDTGLSQGKNNSNVVRNVPDYYVTPTPCTNIPLSGTSVPKTRWKQRKNYTDNETSITDNVNHASSTVKSVNNTDTKHGHQSWGQCTGKIVYQHNLLLGLKGPSNLDAVFEVIIQGPICITCVEALRYNETRAMVSLDSGGRGYEYVKLKLKGYENEGFSYIIKVWGVRKRSQDCNDIN